jgi:glyoxylase-like metal-dependent hydrolase (beta-lactamase superfamily II)
VSHIYVHLIEIHETSSLILIDCGPTTDEAFITLKSYIQSIGYTMDNLEACIVTHSHYEHYGMLERIKQNYEVKVLAHPAMLDFSSIDFNGILSLVYDMFITNGMPQESVEKFLSLYQDIMKNNPIPLIDEVIHHRDFVSKIPELQIIWTPGHAADHLCIYNENTKAMFTGDHVISKVTSQIGLTYVAQSENPMKVYQQSLKELLNYDIEVSYPGHNRPIENTHERITEILKHHESRESWILKTLNSKKLTAFEIGSQIFGDKPSTIGHYIISCTETIAHLKFLEVKGKVNEILKDGVYYYKTMV